MFEILDGNYKSGLMNISALYFGADQPIYVHFDYGPHHAKVFLCICIFQEQTSSSKGRTKAEAEQFASREMLSKIEHCFFKKIERKWVFSPDKKHALLPQETLAALGDLVQEPRHEVLSLYGDALLRYFIVRYLFDEYAQFPEGILTRITSEALKEETRALIAQHLSLNQLIPGEATPKKLARILTAAMGKLACADSEISSRNLVMEQYKAFIDHAVANILRDHMLVGEVASAARISTQIHNFKNELQEYLQKRSAALATYTLIGQEGSAHEPSFRVACHCASHQTLGTGKTKKSAEQEAAREMLTLVHRRDAASTRMVGTSKSYASHESQVKRFQAPDLYELKKSIRWPHFESLDYLQLAFTHPSQNADDNYQRLEFLGDAILKKILLAHLLRSYPTLCDKAALSPAVDQLVSAETQAQIASGFNLGNYIYTQADLSETILGDVLEALIASIYLDAETGAADTFDMSRKNPEAVIVSWFRRSIALIFDKPAVRSPIFAELRRFSTEPQIHKHQKAAEASAAEDFPELPIKQPKSEPESETKRLRMEYASATQYFYPTPPKAKARQSTIPVLNDKDAFPPLPTPPTSFPKPL